MDDALADTNVAHVADAEVDKDPCSLACVTALEDFVGGRRRLVLDRQGCILDEYLRQNLHRRQPGPGGAFVIWAVTNQANPATCAIVDIHEHPQREFEEFPADSTLASFDRSDRKFVAAAIAHGARPHILNASDSDWAAFAAELKPHVNVRQLC